MVGLDDPVQVLQRNGGDGLVGQAEAGQDGHRRLARQALQQRQLHVGEHQPRVAVAHQDGPRRQRAGQGHPVHRTGTAPGQGVDAETEPGQIDERQAREEDEALAEAGPEQGHGVLPHRRAAGDGEAHVALLGRRQQAGGDRLVDLADGAGGLVDGVETLEFHALGGEVGHRRVTGRPHETPLRRHGQEGVAGGGQQEVGAARAEAGDDDATGPGVAPALGHPPIFWTGLSGDPGASPGRGCVGATLSVRSVLGFGTIGGTTSGGWSVAGGWNVP